MKIEIDKQLAVLKPEKQALVLGAFAPIIQELNTFGTEFPKIQEMEQTPEKSAKAKWFRIDFKKAVNLADAKRKDLKEGKAIQSVFNYINIEKAEKEIRRKDRLNELENFGVDGSGLQLGEMEDSIWQNFLLGARTQFEAAAKAEKDEAERLRKIDKAKAIHGERKDQMFKYWDFLPDQINVQDFSIYTPEEFKELLSDMVQEKDKYNKEQEETRLENEKLFIVVEYLSNTVEQISDNFAKELLIECSESILDFAEKL